MTQGLSVLIALLILAAAFSLVKRLFPLKADEARREAILLGIVVSDVERECPYFGNSTGDITLKKSMTPRYALPRSRAGAPWEMVQRNEKFGAQMPNGYLVQAKEVTPKLLEALRPIAEEFSEEYFEFEATEREVAVFWSEWGGARQAAVIHQALMRLQNT